MNKHQRHYGAIKIVNLSKIRIKVVSLIYLDFTFKLQT
jgi:hypothetical protein